MARDKIKTKPKAGTGGRLRVDPATTAKGSAQKDKVLVSFEHFNRDCCDGCSADAFANLLGKLRTLCSMTWQLVDQSPRHACGWEKIPRHSLRCPWPPHLSDDVEFLRAFRFDGKAPMLCHRHHDVLQVIWLDHNFTAYDHG